MAKKEPALVDSPGRAMLTSLGTQSQREGQVRVLPATLRSYSRQHGHRELALGGNITSSLALLVLGFYVLPAQGHPSVLRISTLGDAQASPLESIVSHPSAPAPLKAKVESRQTHSIS